MSAGVRKLLALFGVTCLSLYSSPVAAAPTVSIVRVDQARPTPGTAVTIVYTVKSGTIGDLVARVVTGLKSSEEAFSLAPGTETVRTATVTAGPPGSMTVKVAVGEAVGQMLDCNSIGICHGFKTSYGNFVTRSRAIKVFAATDPILLGPAVAKIGPDFPDGPAADEVSPAGVIGRLAGSAGRLIAIGKTSGLWLMTSGQWKPLWGSPRYAHRIAIDPTDSYHMAVAEYLAPEVRPELSDSGVWESWDAGVTWGKVYPKVGAERINDVAFGPGTGTLFVATTDHGLLRRPKTWSTAEARYQFESAAATTDLPYQNIVSLATGESTIWAASTSQLFRSQGDGRFDAQTPVSNQPFRGWTVYDLPAASTRFALDVRTPDRGRFPDMWPADGARIASVLLQAFEVRRFAAFDGYAYLPIKTFVDVPAPAACRSDNQLPGCSDPSCNPDDDTHYNPAATLCEATGNNSTILTFDVARNQWFVRTTGDNDGTGLGGQRFMKAYVTICSAAVPGIGGRLQLFHGSGQGVQQAAAVNAQGEILWSDVARSANAPFHWDVWDAHIPRDYCPGPSAPAFVATDGGVFTAVTPGAGIGERPNPNFNGNIGQMAWHSLNSGLHTHNVHDIAVVNQTTQAPALIAYITTDNGGWYRGKDQVWRHDDSGDAGLVGADPRGQSDRSNAVAAGFLMRGLHNTKAMFDWGSSTSSFDLNDDPNLFADHDSGFRVVPSQPTDTADGKLRVVTLAMLPLTNKDGTSCCSDAATGLRVLINKDFAAHPRMVDDHWAAIGPELPNDARRLWTAGARDRPDLFVSAGTSGSGDAKLLHWTGGSSWTEVATDLLPAEHVAATGWIDAPGPAPKGSVFVKATSPIAAFAIVDGAPPLVQLRGPKLDRCGLPALSALLSHSGRIAFDGRGNQSVHSDRFVFFWGDELEQVGTSFHGGGFTNPSDMAFQSVDGPAWVAVSSPYGDLFVAKLGVKPLRPGGRPAPPAAGCDPLWHDVTGALPVPGSPLSSVAWNKDTLIVGTEGHGLLAVTNVAQAPVATYFELTSATPPRLVLRRGDGIAVPYAKIHLTLRQLPATPDAVETATAQHFDLRGDAHGEFDLPPPTPPCPPKSCTGSGAVPPIAYAVFSGDGELAPTEFRWRH